jgi:hypothetical protein
VIAGPVTHSWGEAVGSFRQGVAVVTSVVTAATEVFQSPTIAADFNTLDPAAETIRELCEHLRVARAERYERVRQDRRSRLTPASAPRSTSSMSVQPAWPTMLRAWR